MKLLGFVLLFAGWLIVVTALAIFPPNAPRNAFILAGVGVEFIGLFFAARAHPLIHGEDE